MNFSSKNMLMYAVTDRAWEKGEYTLEKQLVDALEGGATCIQIREKDASFDEFLAIAKNLKEITKKYDVPLLINDNIDVAIACDADGVHIGQSDMEAMNVRKILGKDKIIGVTVKTVAEAQKAEKAGADYLGTGAMFGTKTKLDAGIIDHNLVREICNSVSIPVVSIGGITYENMDSLEGLSLDGVALVSEIFAKENIKEHTKKLLEKSINIFKG